MHSKSLEVFYSTSASVRSTRFFKKKWDSTNDIIVTYWVEKNHYVVVWHYCKHKLK
jgi:hypothetical protein